MIRLCTLIIAGFMAFFPAGLSAQVNDTPPASRADEIRAQRRNKAGVLRPDKPSKVEAVFDRIEDFFRESPVRIESRGLGAGAGFAITAAHTWNTAGDNIRGHVWGSASVHRFYTVGTGLEFPHLTANDLGLALDMWHQDSPRLEYYGLGPNSSIDNRTNFRREQTAADVTLKLPEFAVFGTACRLGALYINVGPGTNQSFPTTEAVFSPAEAPGIDVQTNFLRGGCGIHGDWLDLPGDPHRGTYASAAYDRYEALEHDQFSFHRVAALAEHYIPFFNEKRVIALRGLAEWNFHSDRQVVPFYLQPSLATDLDLRGFRRYRFYDENLISLSAEYRWEVNTGFDMAIFGDTGKVFDRPGETNLSDMEESAGFGIRLKSRNNVFARLDTGFSKEGLQIWFRFGTPF